MEINKIYCGHAIDVLRTLPEESAQCVITSSPYWGLRDYETDPIVWGGDPECKHEWGDYLELHDEREETIHGKTRTTDRHYGDQSRRYDGNHQKHSAGAWCQKCGAWLGCLGLEPSPELFVSHLVMVMREVWRVLRPDGTLWLNIGDSYYGQGFGTYADGNEEMAINAPKQYSNRGTAEHETRKMLGKIKNGKHPTLKNKDLVMIPFRLALALQEDGWYIRSDIVWEKSNCMPDSVTDRPTKSHEYIFLCAKSGKPTYWTHRDKSYRKGVYEKPEADYIWWDEKTQLELKQEPADWRDATFIPENEAKHEEALRAETEIQGEAVKAIRRYRRKNLWRGHDYFYDHAAILEPYTEPLNRWGGDLKKTTDNLQNGSPYESAHRERDVRPTPEGRNRRTVWKIPTTSFPGAHFATFPKNLIRPMILAGTKPGDVILDPFCGAGTVPVVALELGRQYWGIDNNAEYVKMAEKRIRETQPGLAL